MHVPPFVHPGARVVADGNVAGGSRPFVAEVVALRKRFPPIHVRFLECVATGATHPLALPQPREAYVTSAQVAPSN